MIVPAAILALIGAIIMVSGAAWWIVFGVLMWVGMFMLFGGRRRYRRQMRAQRRQWAVQANQVPMAAPGPAPLPPPPQPAVNLTRLPPDADKQADRIRRKAAVLGQHPDRFPMGSRDLYVVQRTAAEYLPATVNAYLQVPSWSVDAPTPDGRTPLQILDNQLDLLEGKLDEIAENVRKQRVDNLLANERFLEEHFGRSSSSEELTIPR